MRFIIGMVVLFGCVFGGYMAEGGLMGPVFQPYEILILLGAAVGSMIVGNPGTVIKGMIGGFKSVLGGPSYGKNHYNELLGCLYALFRIARTKGDLALESHVENPQESTIFSNFPTVVGDHHNVDFMCDYLRMLTLGITNAMEVGDNIDEVIENHHNEVHLIPAAYQGMADGLPAFGIVAAVLGIVHTMGYLTEPPEVLGEMVGAALVGTMMGIFFAYGIFAPISSAIGQAQAEDAHYFAAIKAGLIAHMHGNAPQISVEFARQTLSALNRPTFAEVDEMLQTLPNFA